MGFESSIFTWLGVMGLIYIGTLIERFMRFVSFRLKLVSITERLIHLKKEMFN